MLTFLDVLREHQWDGLAAFIVTVLSTPIAVQVAMRTGVLDKPDSSIKTHARPTPYLGGAAILLGWSVSVAIAMAQARVSVALILPIFLGGVAMTVIGLIDDIKHIHGRIRLALTTAVTLAVCLTTDTGVRLVDSVFGPLHLQVPHAITLPLSIAFCVFVVLGACNSMNLIDGLDGLCSGVTAIISLGFFLLASWLAVWGYSKEGDPVRLTLSLAMFGAVMGFLPWNFNPARIFMGDAGSLLIGYHCGITILLFAERGILRWVIGALMIFALPVFDTALTLFRRWRKGQSIYDGDRSHFYDQLVQRGLTVKQSVLVCYGLSVLFGALGLLTMKVPGRFAIMIYAAVCIAAALLAWKFKLTHPEEFAIERKEREARERRRAETQPHHAP